MAISLIDPGSLRTELVLETPVAMPDGQGGHADQWTETALVFARIEPAGLRTRFAAMQPLEEASHRIICRYRDDVTAGMRFRRGERHYLILATGDADGAGRYLTCMTREQRP